MTAKQLERRLEAILPPEQIIVGSELRAAYTVDGKGPAVIVRPCNALQTAQVLALCNEEGASIIPWGGGTQISLGNPPRSYDVALDLSDLDAIHEYDAANLTLTAGAGCTLGVLAERLAEGRQFLPLDPPLAERATLGGVMAAGAFGPSRLRYGAPRDLALGLEAALVTGEVIDVGGKTVKNVAGYDLTRLFIGSYGTLGIITRVTCRLLPLPAASQTVFVGFRAAESALALAGAIIGSKLLPTSLDVLSGDPLEGNADLAACLVIGVDGSPETVERQERELRALAGRAGAASVKLLDAASAANARRLARDLPATSKAGLALRAGLPLAAQARWWAGLAERPGVTLLARAGLGIVYALAEVEARETAGLVTMARQLAGELGGYVVIERAPIELKSRLDVWGEGRPDLALMRELKRKFDPQGILNPGRFMGRL
jgi:glycolate oxidase FAD binding subunit